MKKKNGYPLVLASTRKRKRSTTTPSIMFDYHHLPSSSYYYYYYSMALVLFLFLTSSSSTMIFVFSFTATTATTATLRHPSSSRSTSSSSSSRVARIISHMAKRNKKQRQDMDRWYDDVSPNASPEDVYREEIQRQRLLNKVPDSSINTNKGEGGGTMEQQSGGLGDLGGGMGVGIGGGMMGGMNGGGMMGGMNGGIMMGEGGVGGGMGGLDEDDANSSPPMNAKQIEATLVEYAAFMVSDNWLDDEKVLAMMASEKTNDDDLFWNDNAKPLDEQLDDWETNDDSTGSDSMWSKTDDEPWDRWGEEKEEENDNVALKNDPEASEYLLKDDDNEQDLEELKAQEELFMRRLSQITIQSTRLQKAKRNPSKVKEYFRSRVPDEIEGYDRMWVSAIDNVCFKSLVGVFREYGVQFADNFGDWENGSIEDMKEYTIEEIASYKARQVYETTGMPCIASRTSFEVEPAIVPDNNNMNNAAPPAIGGNNRPPKIPAINSSPRVVSGYRFNDIGMHVDYICEALKPVSDDSRVTRFKTCFCYYDGSMEVFDYGVCDVDLYFANSLRTFIPVAQAIQEMMETLQLAFGLEYQSWLQKRVQESFSVDSSSSGTRGSGANARVKLRDRVLKDGKVLQNDIVDVSAFMDSRVDVNLMDDCAKELSNCFIDMRTTKILTVATTGLVIALPMAKYLQVPVVYARKERNVVMADTYSARYSSKTVGKNRELVVSTNHLDADDRVLIVDDFLSSGSSQEALLRILADSGATPVGIGILLEKVYDSGRLSLSGYDIPIISLCRISSTKGGVIQLEEEDGFDRM